MILAIGDIDGDNCSEVVILGCKRGLIVNSLRAIAIDNLTPASACAVLSRDDELNVAEETLIERGYDGKLVGNYSRGSKITLKHGVYFIKSGNRVSKVVIR